jgi:hypothetical protein
MTNKSEITFVNSVAVSGFNNGICNIAFSTAEFVPGTDKDGKAVVDAKEFISANLRMDLFCAQQLHDSLASILAQQTKPAKEGMN